MNFLFIAFAGVFLFITTAWADDSSSHWQDETPIKLSGFGTLGISHLSNKNADFATNAQPNGPGRSKNIDFGLDSRLGLQLDYALTDHTTLTIQTVSERNADKAFTPYLSLANLRQQFDNGLTIRIGRTQPTTYLSAEYRLANYANPWVRPPVSVYGLTPLIAQEAIDVSYPLATDYGIFTGWVGLNRFDFDASRNNASGTDPVKGRKGRNIGFKWQQGSWTAKFGWSKNNVTYESPSAKAAIAGIRLFDPVAANTLAISDAPVEIISAGLIFEDDDWLMMAEWGERKSDSALPNSWGAYLTLGKHVGIVLPYFTLQRRQTSGSSFTSSNAFANSIIDQLFAAQDYSDWSVSFGMSYPISKNSLLKFQIDCIKPDKNSYGPYINQSSSYDLSHPSTDTLISLNLDFVF